MKCKPIDSLRFGYSATRLVVIGQVISLTQRCRGSQHLLDVRADVRVFQPRPLGPRLVSPLQQVPEGITAGTFERGEPDEILQREQRLQQSLLDFLLLFRSGQFFIVHLLKTSLLAFSAYS